MVVPAQHPAKGGLGIRKAEEEGEVRQGEGRLLAGYCQVGIAQVEHDLVIKLGPHCFRSHLRPLDKLDP